MERMERGENLSSNKGLAGSIKRTIESLRSARLFIELDMPIKIDKQKSFCKSKFYKIWYLGVTAYNTSPAIIRNIKFLF